ncbi:MAG: enoyl-CoA hydratase/carnithine racemase [Halioglobus sp.]|jgi:enoyl-CoA hydratase/carnithine racemase
MAEPQAKIEPYVLESLSENVQWLTLNRPKQRNPLSSYMIAALKASIEAANDNPGVRCIVMASSGPVFSAGHDLKEMSFHEGESRAEHRARVEQILVACSQMMLAILHSPKTVIASVHATATAAGCQLVSACDLAIASEAAKFCTPGVNIGGFCTTPLVGVGRNIHRKHAMELALTGDMFSAEDAVRFGLINRAVPVEELQGETQKLASKIAAGSALGIRSGKEVFYRQLDMPIEQAFEYANQAMLDTMSSPESDEGISAFLEKRDPKWGEA